MKKDLSLLKKALNLKNEIHSLEKILDENKYVITKDNFRKMILILYRIISNIPVILYRWNFDN